MQVRDNVLPHLRRVKAELEKLNGTRIKIGIQGNADSELLMIARVHEYGATITPKATRNLCIPIHKDSYDKSPRDFQDLFFIRSRSCSHKINHCFVSFLIYVFAKPFIIFFKL